jgi:DNA-binding CsgD family transcriptional regulator
MLPAIINALQSIRDPEELLKWDSALFENIPFALYWKDRKGTYLGANHFIATKGGYQETQDVLGLVDFDFTWIKEAPIFRHNDQQVIETGALGCFLEPSTHAGNMKAYAISHKLPLKTRLNKIIGCIGLSFQIDPKTTPIPLSLWDHPLLYNTDVILSPRQIDCLYRLVLGMTIREIGESLALSYKTVEHYIETVKMKLNCSSRSQLIRKAFSLTAIKDLLRKEGYL